ncbi:Dihydrofolate reductase [Agromyces sp. CF514]|uniref:dihydrofolate reductase family protein n=1 Tax=Agromyces sp. CF514 TaxID=1881031 RepID=UPI0008E62616|nr:dihydrofolate reductase family protein [Agromyces sp. CF514]SFR70994.1 Dihydrofolate reductase [Agromyces sp. CF514]
MRTVTLGMNVSLDGYVATDDGGLDWVFPNFSPELMASTQQVLGGLDTVLMGRKNYEGQAESWANADGPIAEVMNGVQKVVFSKTLERASWVNSTLATAAPEDEIPRLKALPGGPIGASGGAAFAQYLSSHGLIDEYRLTVHPVVLGSGLPLFTTRIAFDLVDAVEYPNGVTVRTLRPKAGDAAGETRASGA